MGRIGVAVLVVFLHVCAAYAIFFLASFDGSASPVITPSQQRTEVPPPDPHFLLTHDARLDAPRYASSPPPRGSRVLVLGSGGLVGRSVVTQLQLAGYDVEEVRNRRHIDLRVPGALDRFESRNISFVMFLACEVGGSKFLHATHGSAPLDIIANNMQIYATVFEWLGRTRTPFLFTSTSLVLEPDSYGSMKRVGEAWVKALRVGKIARLWNIYGTEPITHKSHVVGDWAHACAVHHQLHSLSDGTELRRFVHNDDCARGLIALMEHYDEAEFVSDIAGDRWITLRELAQEMIDYFDDRRLPPCRAHFSTDKAVPRALIEPREDSPLAQWWRPRITLKDGVAHMIEYYLAQQERTSANDSTTATTTEATPAPVPAAPPVPTSAIEIGSAAALREEL